MFLSTRSVSVPELLAQQTTRALVHARFRVHAVSLRGIVAEDGLYLRAFPRLGRLTRSVLTVVFQGRARISHGDTRAWLEAGDIAVLSDKHQVSMRQDGQPGYDSLVFEWDDGVLGDAVDHFECGRLCHADLEALHTRHAAFMGASDAEHAAEALGAAIGLLHANGLPVHACSEPLDETIPERLRIVAQALDRCLSELDTHPMLVDLVNELGVGERQVQRLVGELNERFGFNAGNWRDTLVRRRVMAGANLMTARGATTEKIARLVGYASPAAFCRALAQHGLPAPGAVCGEVQRLL